MVSVVWTAPPTCGQGGLITLDPRWEKLFSGIAYVFASGDRECKLQRRIVAEQHQGEKLYANRRPQLGGATYDG
jgi:hypothetical protein